MDFAVDRDLDPDREVAWEDERLGLRMVGGRVELIREPEEIRLEELEEAEFFLEREEEYFPVFPDMEL